MAFIVRKAKTRLTFRENKPEVHVMRRLIFPKVTGKQAHSVCLKCSCHPTCHHAGLY